MKRVHARQADEKGFTLIEVLIGVSIFAIGMLAVAKMQMATVRNTTLGNVTSQATMLAHQKMEVIKTTSFDDLVANEVENNLDAEGNPGGIFNRTTTIVTPPDPLGSHVRQVAVQVQWEAFHGGDRTIVVNSLTYERW